MRYHPDALDQLRFLHSTPSLSRLHTSVCDALDTIENRPWSDDARKVRYQAREVWGVPARGNGEDWIVLWTMSEGKPAIRYIGPRPRT